MGPEILKGLRRGNKSIVIVYSIEEKNIEIKNILKTRPPSCHSRLVEGCQTEFGSRPDGLGGLRLSLPWYLGSKHHPTPPNSPSTPASDFSFRGRVDYSRSRSVSVCICCNFTRHITYIETKTLTMAVDIENVKLSCLVWLQ